MVLVNNAPVMDGFGNTSFFCGKFVFKLVTPITVYTHVHACMVK